MTESDYFAHLEYRVSRELEGMPQKELRRYWCDGFLPDEFTAVGQSCQITGRVWVVSGQNDDCWDFVVHLGPARPREKIDWFKMVPAENMTGWLSIDDQKKLMKIFPLDAYPDRDPAGPDQSRR